jgi:hypothetical protein
MIQATKHIQSVILFFSFLGFESGTVCKFWINKIYKILKPKTLFQNVIDMADNFREYTISKHKLTENIL